MILSPLTGSPNITLLKVIKTEKIINDWLKAFNIDIKEEFQGNKDIYLYLCNETQLKFFTPFEVVGSSKLYEKLQKKDDYYLLDKWEHRYALNDLKNCNNLLEIGSGSGHFIKLCIDSGINIRGIELNPKSVETAKLNNLPVDLLDLEKVASQYTNYFDAVCSFQVLEHTCNPKDFIMDSLKVLKSNGILIYCVPNSNSFLGCQDHLLDMPPHHMLQWSKESLKSLERLFPVKLEKLCFEPLSESNIALYLDSYKNYFLSVNSANKLFFNSYTLWIYEKILKLGLRKLLVGHSVYAKFRKL
jgi:2-polyprenyl-3-methyl-5-hydroxy-6-metoxy-1,4-benzoquinol methylase